MLLGWDARQAAPRCCGNREKPPSQPQETLWKAATNILKNCLESGSSLLPKMTSANPSRWGAVGPLLQKLLLPRKPGLGSAESAAARGTRGRRSWKEMQGSVAQPKICLGGKRGCAPSLGGSRFALPVLWRHVAGNKPQEGEPGQSGTAEASHANSALAAFCRNSRL